MSEITSDLCRLCLKECFTLHNIYSSQTTSGELVYHVLNYVYDLEVSPDDGLLTQICAPCMWKMLEFEGYKRNVHFARVEIVKLLSKLRHASSGGTGSRESDGSPFESDSAQEVNVKEEIDIEEWQMPEELKRPMDAEGDGSESLLQADGNIMNIQQESASSEVISKNINLELKQEELIIDQEEAIQTPAASDLTNMLSLEASEEAVGSPFEGESIGSTQSISVEMRDTKKGKHEEDLRDDIEPEEESLSSEVSKSILDVRKSGRSQLKAPPSKRTEFICDVCKKSFGRKRNLGHHVRVHYDERPFNCRKCDKTFKFDTVRNIHELRHLRDEINSGKGKKGTKKRPYSCVLCAKKFSSKIGLSRHSNLHSNKYKCSSCGKCFGDNSVLKRHLRTHTKEKPFECKVCLKCFNLRGCLNRHLLIHSSERQYVCDICDKRFKTKRNKTEHALSHLRKK